MTDLSHQQVAAVAGPRPVSKRWALLPYLLVFAAGAAGLGIGHAMSGDADAFESKLLLLLRFMAAMKCVAVLAAAGATHWRLKQPIDPRFALGYFVTLAPMAAAAGLIWSLGGIALGAVLFHMGLLAFLVLAWKDDGIRVRPRR